MIDAAHLDLSGVSLTLGERLVLEGVDLTARRGEVLVVLGPSGCGKTSLLRLIAGLIAPDQGSVLIEGASPVPGEATAMVFQSYRLLPWKTVRGNLAFALPHLPPPSGRRGSRRRWPWSASPVLRMLGRESCRAGCSSVRPWRGLWLRDRVCC